MGTRHLSMIRLNGEIKLANYGQWDGYPEGQGLTVAKFIAEHLRTVKDRKAFAAHAAKLTWATDAEVEASWTAVGVEGDYATDEHAKKHAKRFPEFNRNTGAEIFGHIAKGKVKKVQDEREFLKDGLSCEWAWCLNLDTENVEIHCGGVKPDRVISFQMFARYDHDRLAALHESLREVKTAHWEAWQRADDERRAKEEADKEARLAKESAEFGVVGRTYRGLPLYKTFLGWYCNGIQMRTLADVKRAVGYMRPTRRGAQGASAVAAVHMVYAYNNRKAAR